jgi:hypothetical protein
MVGCRDHDAMQCDAMRLSLVHAARVGRCEPHPIPSFDPPLDIVCIISPLIRDVDSA